MRVLGTAWEAVASLLIEDGWIAGGTVAALVATGVWEAASGGMPALFELGGPLLFVLLMGLLLANLYAAGRNARKNNVQQRRSSLLAG